jgi:hypothetical protein
VPYALAQEFGGTIRPRSSKYLMIPTAHGLTGSGRQRFPTLRNVANTFIRPSKRGTGLLVFQRYGKKIKPRLIATLQAFVTLKPRLGFVNLWKSLAPSRMERVRFAIRKALTKGGVT